ERAAGGRYASRAGRQMTGTSRVARRGTLPQLLPTQLALPEDLLMVRYLRRHLLYRRHTSYLPPAPQPVTIVLDTTPPCFGAAESVLRLAAHLITVTLWEHGQHPLLVTLTAPGTATAVTSRAQLAQLWTTRT